MTASIMSCMELARWRSASTDSALAQRVHRFGAAADLAGDQSDLARGGFDQALAAVGQQRRVAGLLLRLAGGGGGAVQLGGEGAHHAVDLVDFRLLPLHAARHFRCAAARRGGGVGHHVGAGAQFAHQGGQFILHGFHPPQHLRRLILAGGMDPAAQIAARHRAQHRHAVLQRPGDAAGDAPGEQQSSQRGRDAAPQQQAAGGAHQRQHIGHFRVHVALLDCRQISGGAEQRLQRRPCLAAVLLGQGRRVVGFDQIHGIAEGLGVGSAQIGQLLQRAGLFRAPWQRFQPLQHIVALAVGVVHRRVQRHALRLLRGGHNLQ
ncbi:hypothetical protein ABEV37_07285 [Chromobacterium piscinae]